MTVDELLAAVGASDPPERAEHWRPLVEALGDDALDPIVELLASADVGLERFAIDVLGAMAATGHSQAFSALNAAEAIVSVANVPHLVNARCDAARLLEPTAPDRPPRDSREAQPADPTPLSGTSLVIERINGARRRRGEPELDGAEAKQVLASLEVRAARPDRYRNICWYCHAPVDDATHEECRACGWRICWCGACRDPKRVDRLGRSGACRRGAWAFANELALPDRDQRGVPILTAIPPSRDARSTKALLEQARIRAVYHWSPARAIPTILEFGILARPWLDVKAIPYQPHVFGARAKEEHLGRFVCLSAKPKSRMMEAWSDRPVVWEVDPEVLTTQGTLFLPNNSARSDVMLAQALAATGADACRAALNAVQDPLGQPEFLVPGRVPRAALGRAFVPDDEAAHAVRQQGERLGWMVEVRTGLPNRS